jgi:hypothetical protein
MNVSRSLFLKFTRNVTILQFKMEKKLFFFNGIISFTFPQRHIALKQPRGMAVM